MHERDCTLRLDNQGKGLERQRMTILATLKASFPQALAALVVAGGKPFAKSADSAMLDTKAPDTKAGSS